MKTAARPIVGRALGACIAGAGTILLTLMLVFVSGAACCFVRFITAIKYWG
jgi:hypothetical protein